MTSSANGPFEPAAVTLTAAGRLDGASGSYDKYWGGLAGLYYDEAAYEVLLHEAGPHRLAYHVDEIRGDASAGALIIGTSTLLPGLVGEEFAMTRGHLHARSDRAEMYHCVSGRGVMIMDTVDGQSRAVEMGPGDIVYVPGEWVHRSVNTGTAPFVTVFCYAADAGQDYDVIAQAGGMSQMVVRDGSAWALRPNPRHQGYRRESSPTLPEKHSVLAVSHE